MKDTRTSLARRGRWLLAAWLALIALMLSSLASAYVPMGPWNLVAGLAIATAKSLIVLCVFMGLVRASALLRIAAAAGFGALALLFALGGVDYITRKHPAAPVQQPRQFDSETLQGHTR